MFAYKAIKIISEYKKILELFLFNMVDVETPLIGFGAQIIDINNTGFLPHFQRLILPG